MMDMQFEQNLVWKVNIEGIDAEFAISIMAKSVIWNNLFLIILTFNFYFLFWDNL